MAIDPVVLAKQRAGWERAQAAPVPRLPRSGGPRLTDALCPRCEENYLAVTNTKGVCGPCWQSMSPKQRREVEYRSPVSGRFTGPLPKPRPRAWASSVEKARAKLEAKGFTVRAA